MSSGTYRNLGRGGAGNYYSKADLDNATKLAKQRTKDLEAQNTQPGAAAADDTPSTPEYSRLGRGGAGNVTLSALMAAATASSPQPPVDSSRTRQWSGRGGAGNFLGAEQSAGDAGRAAEEAMEAKMEAQHRIEEDVKVDVEKGLAPPQKAYMGP
ncbi:MAG: hypothetical protein M1840_004318 [Geoglossum simile]|nr:MAG: hypothetical protein M1840_004318 [Geoglossum simile]